MTSTTHLNCFYDKEQVISYVSRTGNAHSFANIVFYKDGDLVKSKKCLDAHAYFSSGSLDGTTATIDLISNMSSFKQKYPFMRQYTIETVLPGRRGSFRVKPHSEILLWGAQLKPTFFDAEVFTVDHMNCYSSRKSVPGL